MNWNRAQFGGRLTRDPTTKTLPNGTVITEFGMCANRTWTKDGEKHEEACFVDATAFGKQAELIAEHCRKGSELFVDARLKFETWEDKQGGKRSKLSLVLNDFQFMGKRADGDGGADDFQQRDERRPAPQQQQQQRQQPQQPQRQGVGRRSEQDDSPF